MISAAEQVKIIIFYIIFGIFIGITFDTLRILTSNDKTKKRLILSYFCEITYWILISYICTLFIIKNTSHYITIYSILFFVIGIFIYYSLLQKGYQKNFLNIKKQIVRIFKMLIPLLLPLEFFHFFKKVFKKKRAKKTYDS